MKKYCINRSEKYLYRNITLVDKITLVKAKLNFQKFIASKENKLKLNDILWNVNYLYNNLNADREQLISILERIEYLERKDQFNNIMQLYIMTSEYVKSLTRSLNACDNYLKNYGKNQFNVVLAEKEDCVKKHVIFIKKINGGVKNGK